MAAQQEETTASIYQKTPELCRGRDPDGALRALHAALKRGKATGIDDELSVVHEAIDAGEKTAQSLCRFSHGSC